MDKSTSIRLSLEKILKALLVKIDSGDEKSVSEELIWYENFIDELFSLHKKKRNRFFEIMDPESFFQIEGRLDPKNIHLREGNITAKKAYLVNAVEAEGSLLDTFFSFGSKLWESGIKHDRNEVATRAIRSLGKLYYLIVTFSDPNFRFTGYFKFFSDKIYLRVTSVLAKDFVSKSDVTFASYLLITTPLDCFSGDNFPEASVEIMQRILFSGLRVSIDYDQERLLKDYVRTATLLPFRPFPPGEIHSLADLLYRHFGLDSLTKQFNQIIYLYGRSVFTQKDYAELADKLQEIKDAMSVNQNIVHRELPLVEEAIQRINSYAFRSYKYKQVQKALNHGLIYCIFKEKYGLVEYAFQFHSPQDADAHFGNDDIIFYDLVDILRLASLGGEIESELMFIWPDHHGTRKYINIYLISLFARFARSNDKELDNAVPLGVNYIVNLEKSKGVFNEFRWPNEIDQLELFSEHLIVNNQWPFYQSNPTQVSAFRKLILLMKRHFNTRNP